MLCETFCSRLLAVALFWTLWSEFVLKFLLIMEFAWSGLLTLTNRWGSMIFFRLVRLLSENAFVCVYESCCGRIAPFSWLDFLRWMKVALGSMWKIFFVVLAPLWTKFVRGCCFK